MSCAEPIEPAARMTSPRQLGRARFAILPPTHAGGAAAVEHQALDEAVGLQPQIGAIEHRLEKGGRRRPAPAAFLIDVKGAAPFVVAGVEIGNGLDVGLLGCGAEGVEQVPMHPRRLNAQFTADAMCVALAQEVIFVLLEVGQHVVPAPAAESELAPMVVVGGLAAHVDHGVDRRRAADRLAARITEAAAVEAFLRLGLEAPVRARVADGEQIADRDVKPDPIVAAAGLEHQHALGGCRPTADWQGGSRPSPRRRRCSRTRPRSSPLRVE